MTERYRFGSTQLLRDRREIWHDGVLADLGDRAFDLLLLLVEQRHRVVEKDALLQAVWPGRYVEESNLPVQVAALRRRLGRDIIATVHGRGYRFVAPLLDAAAQPVPDPLLFGRDDAWQTVLDTLPGQRLLTLVGPGGVGKTRLARAVVTALRAMPAQQRWIDGINWVDLAAVDQPRHMAQALLLAGVLQADALPLAPASSDDRRPDSQLNGTALAERLRSSRMLLVLDNAEHLHADVAALARALLAETPGMHLLVTSRQALGVTGEHTLVLAGLDSGAAVQMFVARAQHSSWPRDLPPAAQAETLALCEALCAALDGLPLAIELAAARLPVLGLHGLLANLDQCLQALADDRQDRRHRSLLATLDWSYGLLDPAEQAMLRALSVLLGPFDLNLALQVAGVATTDRWVGVQRLEALVRKSLLAPDPQRVQHWRLLHSTRLFGLQALQQQGEEAVVRERLALALCAQHQTLDDAWFSGHGSERDLDRQALASLDNLVAALDWACGVGARPDLAARLLAASARVLKLHGLRDAAKPWVAALLRSLDGSTPAQDALWLGLAQLPLPDAAHRALVQRKQLDAAIDGAAQGDSARALASAWRAAQLALTLSDSAAIARALALGEAIVHPALPARVRANWVYTCELIHQHSIGVAPVPDALLTEVLDDLLAAGDAACRAGTLLRIFHAERPLLQGRWQVARSLLQAVCDDVDGRGPGGAVSAMAPCDVLAMAELGCGNVGAAAGLMRRSFDSARWLDVWLELAAPVAWCLAAQGRHRAAGLLLGAVHQHQRQAEASQNTMACVRLALQQAQQVLSQVQDDATLARWHAEGQVLGRAGLKALLDGGDPRFVP